ncbi:16S rRNA (cytidine(1402)-2'-O)-methyltransferase [Corynebacterium sp. zg-331]|uniref:16S rRNA (cytidine(1402)-2'-O)-methyltransferase n=1 Tax=unclassified Corynebacterium TaxID=2624378 RepID=UPI00128C7A34|nr:MULTISPECIES: 16S rRNA (cytidine(1402)-2'-O)-methyltransferase [unclassified Corynebacterium]MBC3186879.1 16S rRNA (cytidine(1402)-2'-O)-methyltransferase [Corynebacterium sp. zg-331]MPV53359.1 16S rRNA (cytidine(1402)-2'-O)-methyltransferase [Corynebacterium sp. zg331]
MSSPHLDAALDTPLPTGVVLAATPLGNVADATPRLCRLLEQADVVAAEDTRRTRALAQALGVEIGGRVVSNFDHNEQQRVEMLLAAARTGTVAVVTDAGMPVVSDPGLRLVAAALDAGVPVSCAPGPSAVPTALALSGLDVGRFIFDGFAPRREGARRTWLESLREEKRAVCFFESPHRVAETLAAAAEILGPRRRVAVCRELTKAYEEVRRGPLGEVARWAAEGVRGEVTVVLDATAEVAVDVGELVPEALGRVAAGERLKAVCKDLAARHGVRARELYDAALAARG